MRIESRLYGKEIERVRATSEVVDHEIHDSDHQRFLNYFIGIFKKHVLGFHPELVNLLIYNRDYTNSI